MLFSTVVSSLCLGREGAGAMGMGSNGQSTPVEGLGAPHRPRLPASGLIPQSTRRRKDAGGCAAYTTGASCMDMAPAQLECVWVPKVMFETDPSEYVCRTETCENFVDSEPDPESSCADAGCTWHADVYYCQTPGTPMPCAFFYTQAECPPTCVPPPRHP